MRNLIVIILTLCSLSTYAQTETDTDRQLEKLRRKATTQVYKAFKEFTNAKNKLDARINSARRLGLDIKLSADTLVLDTLLVTSNSNEILKNNFDDTFIDPMPEPVAPQPKGTIDTTEPETMTPDAADVAVEAAEYYLGEGKPQDYYKAFSLYREAAEAGSPEGIFGLAICYLEGHGTDKNYPAAVEWLTQAVENGDTDAMYLLGQCYEKGRGVKENIKRAVSLYREAASKGNDSAKEYLKKIGY